MTPIASTTSVRMPADIGDRDRAFGVVRFLGRHGDALDGEEEPDREGNRREHAGDRRRAELIVPGPAAPDEIRQLKSPATTTPMNTSSSKIASSVTTSSNVAAIATPSDIQAHEHDIGADGRDLGSSAGKLHVEIGADGERDGRRREHELDQRREAREVAAHRAEGAAGCTRTGHRHGGSQS